MNTSVKSSGATATGWWALVVLVVCVNVSLALFILGAPGGLGGRRVQIPLFTAQPGGGFVPLGDKLSEVVRSDSQSGLELVALRSGGSVDNLEVISKFENAISFTFIRVPDILGQRKQAKAKEVRAIALLNRDLVQVVVANAEITSIADMQRMEDGLCKYSIYVGMVGSGTRETAFDLLEPGGAACFDSWQGFSSKMTYEEVAAQLRAGTLDAAIFSTGIGAPAVVGLLDEGPSKFRMIALDDGTRRSLVRRGYELASIPTASGSSIPTVSARVLVATHANTQQWIVQDLVSILERHRVELEPLLTPQESDEPSALVTDTGKLESMLESGTGGIPLHEGVRSRPWAWVRNQWLHLAGLSTALAIQLLLIYRFMPRARMPADFARANATATHAPARIGALSPEALPGSHRVFISYAKEDEAFVEHVLVPILKNAGLEVWWAGLLKGGSRFRESIARAIDGSIWVVTVLSPHTQRSDWVKAEAQRGLDKKKGVLPVIIREPCAPNDIHFLFNGLQQINLTSVPDAALVKLIDTLQSEPEGNLSNASG